jgi:hypothetical protein
MLMAEGDVWHIAVNLLYQLIVLYEIVSSPWKGDGRWSLKGRKK